MYPRLELESYKKIGYIIMRLPMVQVGNGKGPALLPRAPPGTGAIQWGRQEPWAQRGRRRVAVSVPMEGIPEGPTKMPFILPSRPLGMYRTDGLSDLHEKRALTGHTSYAFRSIPNEPHSH